tara:strand:+ start:120 stop:440 length:321 start_codon:yes stop_codon:yes gene_type:complete
VKNNVSLKGLVKRSNINKIKNITDPRDPVLAQAKKALADAIMGNKIIDFLYTDIVKNDMKQNTNEILPKITAELVKPLTLVSPSIYKKYKDKIPIKIDAIFIVVIN